ncbi:hypothetical protein LGT41_0002730 [Abyssibius alkaniclasticus]|nr:hypothetical protein [Abyssibius alkaniclasticus]UPH71752.1 hypothetical protein LGT41_0002730 [Abyssibius alkaniclasticus]
MAAAVRSACVTFKMGGHKAYRAAIGCHNSGDCHTTAKARLLRVYGDAPLGKPMAMIIQTDQGRVFKWNRGQDCIAMPAKRIETIGAKRPFCDPAETQFVKFDPEGIGHAKLSGHHLGGMALFGAGHAVVNLGQKNDFGRNGGKMGGGILWKQTALHIPCGDGEVTR